jgi:hypothetical protein
MRKIAIIFGMMFLATACSDRDESLEAKPDAGEVLEVGPDGVALEALFQANRIETLQTFKVNVDSGATVVGAEGTKLFIAPGTLFRNGAEVSGEVDVELVEIYNRAGMLLNNRSTSGVRPDGQVDVLKSAGQFFINARQENEDLELQGRIFVQSRGVAPTNADHDMELFVAGDKLDDTSKWEEAPVGQENGDEGKENQVLIRDGAGGVHYSFDIGNFGWTNLDRWYNYTGEKTQIFVDVPEGYDGDNCALFLSYDGEPSTLASMDVYDDATEMFTEHYGLIPVGQAIHLILVSEVNGELHYAIQGTTIVEGHIEAMPTPMPGTQAELEAMINSLP